MTTRVASLAAYASLAYVGWAAPIKTSETCVNPWSNSFDGILCSDTLMRNVGLRSYTSDGITTVFSTIAEARVGFGELAVYASVDVENWRSSDRDNSFASATARFYDELIVNAPTDGFLLVGVRFEGSAMVNGPAGALRRAEGSIFIELPAFSGYLAAYSAPGANYGGFVGRHETGLLWTPWMRYRRGQTIPLEAILFASTEFFSSGDMVDVAGVADFFNSATIASINIVDSFGKPIPGASIEAASNTIYPVNAFQAPIPEPAPLFLVMSALAGCMLIRRRMRRC